MGLQEVGCGGIKWLDLALDMDRWHAQVNAEINFGFHKMWGIS